MKREGEVADEEEPSKRVRADASRSPTDGTADGIVTADDRGKSKPIHPGSFASRSRQDTQDSSTPKEDRSREEGKAAKKKYALLLAYCGTGYQGLQINPGAHTIEAELERALFKAGAISDSNFGSLSKIGWSRAGRTDKGVHAVGQIIGAKLKIDNEEEFPEVVNSFLPEKVKVLDCIKVTRGFNAKNNCNRRQYVYIAPSFLFADKTTELRRPLSKEQLEQKLSDHVSEGDLNVLLRYKDSAEDLDVSYRMNSDTLATLRSTLKAFEGTHNFHNFTSRLQPRDPKCNRYILSFTAEEPFVAMGLEWVKLIVLGQSFLFNHIRKMVAVAAEVVRGSLQKSDIERFFRPENKVSLPIAPGEGLYLDKLMFDWYDKKFGGTHAKLDFSSGPVVDRINRFREDIIHCHIFEEEIRNQAFAQWLNQLDRLSLFTYQNEVCPTDVKNEETVDGNESS